MSSILILSVILILGGRLVTREDEICMGTASMILLLVLDEDGELWKSVESTVSSVVGLFISLTRWSFVAIVLESKDFRTEDRVE